jgi:hypothetical protein
MRSTPEKDGPDRSTGRQGAGRSRSTGQEAPPVGRKGTHRRDSTHKRPDDMERRAPSSTDERSRPRVERNRNAGRAEKRNRANERI